MTGAADDWSDSIANAIPWIAGLLIAFKALAAFSALNPYLLALAAAFAAVAWAVTDLSSKDSKLKAFWAGIEKECPIATATINEMVAAMGNLGDKIAEVAAGAGDYWAKKVGIMPQHSLTELKKWEANLNLKKQHDAALAPVSEDAKAWARGQQAQFTPDEIDKSPGIDTTKMPKLDLGLGLGTARAQLPTWGGTGATTTDNSTTTINVNGVTDPMQAAHEVKRLLPMTTTAPGGFTPAVNN
jgi:hypothetical protein